MYISDDLFKLNQLIFKLYAVSGFEKYMTNSIILHERTCFVLFTPKSYNFLISLVPFGYRKNLHIDTRCKSSSTIIPHYNRHIDYKHVYDFPV